MEKSLILRLGGAKPGKTVAVFAGVHGNERAGIFALKRLIHRVKIEKGAAFFCIANLMAADKGVRFIEEDLNRLFVPGENSYSLEGKISKALMRVLDQCEALLDLHGYNSEEATPFAITGENGLSLVRRLDFRYVILGVSKLHGGADCYMELRQKQGICLECGPNSHPERHVKLAGKSILQFLKYHDLISDGIKFENKKQRFFRAAGYVLKKTNRFTFTEDFTNFSPLKSGEVFAVDGDKKYFAKDNQYIVFPRSNCPIGKEAFLLLEEIKK